jgi:hypothetical protein
MRILFLLTLSLLLTSISNAQPGDRYVRSDSARRFISVKDFKPGKNVVKVETRNAILYFSQQDFFGFKKQEDTIFYKLDTSNEYESEELLRRGRGLVYDRDKSVFADSISYYTSLYGLRHFYLPGERHVFWVLVFIRSASIISDKGPGADHVVRRELRTIPGEAFREQFLKCDSTIGFY